MTKLVLRIVWTIVYTLLISGAGILFADCPEGARPTTEAEQQGYLASVQALKTAIPNAPDGWELDDGGNALVRTFRFADFSEAFGFLTRVALHAEKDGPFSFGQSGPRNMALYQVLRGVQKHAVWLTALFVL